MDMRVIDRCRRCGQKPVDEKRLCFECRVENSDARQVLRWSAIKDQQ